MSVTNIIKEKDVKERFALILKNIRRPISSDFLVKPSTKHYSLTGTAFDYLLRFEIKRRAPHSIETEWTSESAWFGLEFYLRRQISDEASQILFNALQQAKSYVNSFYTKSIVIHDDYLELANHAITLAKIDIIIRAGILEKNLKNSDENIVNELVALLQIVPWDRFLHSNDIRLNPSFPHASPRTGGGDADLIIEKDLIDIKVIQSRIGTKELNQIFCYLLLAREERRCNPEFPAITSIGFYLARQGTYWIIPVSEITDNSQFVAIEDWFWNYLSERYPPTQAIPLPVDFPNELRPPFESVLPEPWINFLDRLKTNQEIIARWGWPKIEEIKLIPQKLENWRRLKKIPRMMLGINRSYDVKEPGLGHHGFTSLGSPELPGTFIKLISGRSNCRETIRWDAIPKTRYKIKKTIMFHSIPSQFPNLIQNYPEAAWKFFTSLEMAPITEVKKKRKTKKKRGDKNL